MRPANLHLHPLHRLWRALPTQARRRWLARGSALLAPRPDRPAPSAAPGMVVAGEIGRASGLGEGARLMLRGLDVLGMPNWSLSAGLRVPGEDDGTLADHGMPPPGVPIMLHVNAPQMPLALLRLPRRLLRGRRVIGHWAWELPTVPADWRVGPRFVHEVWAPSRFTADALETLMPGRVRVVPYPIAVSPPQPAALDRQAFGLPADAMVSLVCFSLASSFERKNPLGALAAHRRAFGDRSDRILLFKLSHAHHHPDDLARLRAAIGDAPNVRLETRTLPAADAHALTRACDLVLSLHRSEGFGLVPAEAMLLGVPVVATGWSGNMQYMDPDCAALVPYRMIPARDSRGVFEAPGACWAEPDIAAAADHLTRLADDPAARATLAAHGQQAARERLGTAALASAIAALHA